MASTRRRALGGVACRRRSLRLSAWRKPPEPVADGRCTADRNGRIRPNVTLRRSPTNPPKVAVLKDVARRAGVDPSTVSRVLRGDERKPAKAETRERILKVAREMGYRANSVARSLRTRQREAIGLVIPDAANPGFAEIFKGVQAVTAEAGWHVIVVEGRPAHPSRPRLGPHRARGTGRRRPRPRRQYPRSGGEARRRERLSDRPGQSPLQRRRRLGGDERCARSESRSSISTVSAIAGWAYRRPGQSRYRPATACWLPRGDEEAQACRAGRVDCGHRLHGSRRRARGARASRSSRRATCRRRSISRASCRESARSRSSTRPASMCRATFRSSSATNSRSPRTPRLPSPPSTCR